MSEGRWVHEVDPDSGEVLPGEADRERERQRRARLTHDALREPIRVLRPRPALCFGPEVPVAEVVAAMIAGDHVSCVLIVEDDELIGIFTERDVLLRLHGEEHAAGLDSLPIRAVMTADPTVLMESDSLGYALSIMATGGYRHIPIIPKEERRQGELQPQVISARDLIGHLADFFPEEVYNLPPIPVRRGTGRYGA